MPKTFLLENYTSRNIAVIDSRQATGGQGLLLYEMAQMQSADYPFEKSNSFCRIFYVIQQKINFTVENLEYLQKVVVLGKQVH